MRTLFEIEQSTKQYRKCFSATCKSSTGVAALQVNHCEHFSSNMIILFTDYFFQSK